MHISKIITMVSIAILILAIYICRLYIANYYRHGRYFFQEDTIASLALSQSHTIHIQLANITTMYI